MILNFSKYQGAGNDFILIDNRNKHIVLSANQINFLCDRHFGIGADGLILLEKSQNADFKMVYFNSDGKESTMCGNGGRCITMFAKHCGAINKNTTIFEAIDGLHYAEIIEEGMVRLQMQDVKEIQQYGQDYILNTGSPHYVRIVQSAESVPVFEEARKIRYSPVFKEHGINVNFVEIKDPHHIFIRTYERGVENETLACGTGVTAAALVTAYKYNLHHDTIFITTPGGKLKVDFQIKNGYTNIFLTGNATFVFKGEIQI